MMQSLERQAAALIPEILEKLESIEKKQIAILKALKEKKK